MVRDGVDAMVTHLTSHGLGAIGTKGIIAISTIRPSSLTHVTGRGGAISTPGWLSLPVANRGIRVDIDIRDGGALRMVQGGGGGGGRRGGICMEGRGGGGRIGVGEGGRTSGGIDWGISSPSTGWGRDVTTGFIIHIWIRGHGPAILVEAILRWGVLVLDQRLHQIKDILWGERRKKGKGRKHEIK